MVVETEQEPQTAGELIRFWRTRRGLSQLELSLDANAPRKRQGAATRSVSVREYDIADVRPLFAKDRA